MPSRAAPAAVLAPPSGIAERLYTWRDVERRLAEAFETYAALPEPQNGRPSTKVSFWPASSAAEQRGLIEMLDLKVRVRRAVPTARQISEATEAMAWLLKIGDDYARQLVVLRAIGLTWQTLSRRLGWSLRKVQYDHRTVLIALAAELSRSP